MAFDAKAAADRQRQNQQAQQVEQDSEAQLEAQRRHETQGEVEDSAGELVVAVEDRVNRLESLDPDEFMLEAEQLLVDLQTAHEALGSTSATTTKKYRVKSRSDKPKGGLFARVVAKVKEIDQNSKVK